MTLLKRFLLNKWRLLPTLDRWLVNELMPAFLFSIAAFTIVTLSVGVMFDLVSQIVESGLSFTFAIQVFLLKLPGFLVISLPMSMLMATLITFSRLSSNSEVKALKSLGISTRRIILSSVLIGALMSVITFIINDSIVPIANKNAETILVKGLGVSMQSGNQKNIMFSRSGKIIDSSSKASTDGITHLLYAKELVNKKMINVTVLDFSRAGYKQMLLAEKAYWNDNDANWEFDNGRILTIAPNGSSTSIVFENYTYPLDSGLNNISQATKDASYMNMSDAYKVKKMYELSGNLVELRKIKVRIQEKLTLPMACFIFSLIGSSLACKENTRTSKSQGFSLSIILIITYYILSFVFSSLGVSGALSPFLAAWSPIFISSFGGLYLLKRSN